MLSEVRFEDTALALRSQRMAIIASNLANAETPNFKARDLNFAEELQNATKATIPMRSTQRAHITTPLRSTVNLDYTPTDQPSADGNTVDPHKERASFAMNAIRMQAAFQSAVEEYAELSNMMKNLRG